MITKRALYATLVDLCVEVDCINDRLAELEKKGKGAQKEKRKPGRPKGAKNKAK